MVDDVDDFRRDTSLSHTWWMRGRGRPKKREISSIPPKILKSNESIFGENSPGGAREALFLFFDYGMVSSHNLTNLPS